MSSEGLGICWPGFSWMGKTDFRRFLENKKTKRISKPKSCYYHCNIKAIYYSL